MALAPERSKSTVVPARSLLKVRRLLVAPFRMRLLVTVKRSWSSRVKVAVLEIILVKLKKVVEPSKV